MIGELDGLGGEDVVGESVHAWVGDTAAPVYIAEPCQRVSLTYSNNRILRNCTFVLYH